MGKKVDHWGKREKMSADHILTIYKKQSSKLFSITLSLGQTWEKEGWKKMEMVQAGVPKSLYLAC